MNKRNIFCVIFALMVGVSAFGAESDAAAAVAVFQESTIVDLGTMNPKLLDGILLTKMFGVADCGETTKVRWHFPDPDGKYPITKLPARLIEYPLHYAMEKKVACGVFSLIEYYNYHGVDFMAMKDETGKSILRHFFDLLERANGLAPRVVHDVFAYREYESIKDILAKLVWSANYDNAEVNRALTSLFKQIHPFTGERITSWYEVESAINKCLQDRARFHRPAFGARSFESPL
jgi:hypothetical protein